MNSSNTHNEQYLSTILLLPEICSCMEVDENKLSQHDFFSPLTYNGHDFTSFAECAGTACK
jgi:hypothetical protein